MKDIYFFVGSRDTQILIRDEVLEQMINDLYLSSMKLFAFQKSVEQEITSYLSARYDTDIIFKPVYNWSPDDTYSVGERIRFEYFNKVWNNTETFVNGQYVIENTGDKVKVYFVQNSPVAGTPVTDVTKFEFVSNYGDLFTAKTAVVAGTKVSNTTNWQIGDTRDPLIVRYFIDISIYELHCRVNPRNIPEHRLQRRDDAVKWLKMVSDPRNNINPNFPERTFDDKKGLDVSWNSNSKISHYY